MNNKLNLQINMPRSAFAIFNVFSSPPKKFNYNVAAKIDYVFFLLLNSIQFFFCYFKIIREEKEGKEEEEADALGGEQGWGGESLGG